MQQADLQLIGLTIECANQTGQVKQVRWVSRKDDLVKLEKRFGSVEPLMLGWPIEPNRSMNMLGQASQVEWTDWARKV